MADTQTAEKPVKQKHGKPGTPPPDGGKAHAKGFTGWVESHKPIAIGVVILVLAVLYLISSRSSGGTAADTTSPTDVTGATDPYGGYGPVVAGSPAESTGLDGIDGDPGAQGDPGDPGAPGKSPGRKLKKRVTALEKRDKGLGHKIHKLQHKLAVARHNNNHPGGGKAKGKTVPRTPKGHTPAKHPAAPKPHPKAHK